MAQLFLTDLVQDSPTRAHTVVLLRGAQAAFLAHGFLLRVPHTADLGFLSGPGLDAATVTDDIVARIRAGVAHPAIAACLAAGLFTGIGARELQQRWVSLVGPPRTR